MYTSLISRRLLHSKNTLDTYRRQDRCFSLFHAGDRHTFLILESTFIQLSFDLLVDESFVVLQILLHVDFELDHIVQDLFNLGVEFFAQRVCTKSQLLESVLHIC